ncbi:MAG: DNA modification methylase [Chthoniobacterales bacterium]
MKTTNLPLEKLIAYAGNPRRNDHAVEAVAAAIKRFGFRVPVLAKSDGSLIDGHLRIKAAKRLGMAEVPAVLCDDLSEAEIKALRISINRMAELAEWDEELLMAELEGLAAEGITMDDVGFDLDALEELGATVEPEGNPEADAEPQIDKAEELRVKWGVEPGQLWELGDHRLLCGDSTKKEDVERVMGGDKPLLMVTDPPYGVEYDPLWRAKAGVNKNFGKMGKVENDHRVDWTEAWLLFSGDVAYIYHDGRKTGEVQLSLQNADFEIRAQIIWSKDRMALSRGDYHWQHEPCWYAVRKGSAGHRTSDRTQTTVWEIPSRDDRGHGHGTQKPVECMARAIRNHDSGIVYEPFSGSGTTIIACEQLGRKCRAIEISPAYVAVALQRWADTTGKTPRLVP